MDQISSALEHFIQKYKEHLQKPDITYLERTFKVKDPFPKFYITAKVHKSPWKTRPIVSISGSQLHGLGCWVDHILQPFARYVPSYIKSSRALKELLIALPPLPSKARMFTADAVSMYTNIATNDALRRIKHIIERNKHLATTHECVAVLEGLTLIMMNNLFQFGDTYWLQIDGTAMGVSPSCSYATLYYSDHENKLLEKYPEIIFYRRYIDDIFAIWNPLEVQDNIRWLNFQHDLNQCGKLRWETSERSTSINFLDLQLTIESNATISTRLYEKAQNLYLYVPANNSHPMSSLKGLIHGMVFRTLNLTSSPDIQRMEINKLYHRLIARGYQPSLLKQIIEKAYLHIKINKVNVRQQDTNSIRDYCFFHTYFHPNDPPSSVIQWIFRREMLNILNKPTLPELRNHKSAPIGIKRLIVCYHRTPNLGNILSPRLMKDNDGPVVSSFL
jgi:hypothetical protein